MATSRKRPTKTLPSGEERVADWRRMVASVALVTAVVGTLVLGAVLETDAPDPPGRTLARGDAPAGSADPAGTTSFETSSRATPDASRAVVPEADTVGTRRTDPDPATGVLELARRAETDLERLPDDGWMLQIVAACDPTNVRRIAERGAGDRRLHVLPVMIGERPCFRVCWGPYSSRDEAVAAEPQLRAVLGALADAPRPKAVADLLP